MPNSNNNIKPISSIKVTFDGADFATVTVTIKSGDKVAWNALATVDNCRITKVIKGALDMGLDFYPCGSTFVTVNR